MSSPGPAAVVFDLDGTLVDSEPNYYEAGRRVLERHGVGDFTWKDHSEFLGVGTRETLRTLRARYGLAAPVEELLAEKNAEYVRLARASTEPFPQMRKFAGMLHEAGCPTAVASGSSRAAIEAVLPAAGLDGLFGVLVSAEEVARGKPEPDVFLEAARRLGVRPADCVVVEDAPPGWEAARRAGMRCVAVPYLPEQADEAVAAGAGLVFRGGQREFSAERAFAWVTAGG
ncbi:HAD family hydrolase [Streptomyces sp. MAR4 CNX-425]|uniref:HAD family hydrolase n=1 Tax=Streptomyces sp. MAR4 CNX-425 TaxID=3406343 RepID=UPI003B50668B